MTAGRLIVTYWCKGCVAEPLVNECFHGGIYSNGARKIFFGFRLQSLPEEKKPSIDVGLWIVRIELDRLREVRHGAIGIPACDPGDSSIVIRPGVAGIPFDSVA